MMSPTPRLLPELPDPLGFAGMFGGVSGGALLCAGGANFSDRPLAEGGQRVWHDRVFALESLDGTWRQVGRLPFPLGYGVSGTWGGAMVLAGGMDAKRHYAEGWLVRYDGGKLTSESLPGLPVTTANGFGAVMGDEFIVAGGQAGPDANVALNRCFACNLAAPQRRWRELPWPEGAPGRVLAVAAAEEGEFFMFSGAALAPDAQGKPVRTYLTDAWSFSPNAGWRSLANLPRPAAAAPSPAWRRPGGRWGILGGIWPEYLAEASARPIYPGFSREILVYSRGEDRWRSEGPGPQSPGIHSRLVAPAVEWMGGMAVVSGEIAPGTRARGSEFFASA